MRIQSLIILTSIVLTTSAQTTLLNDGATIISGDNAFVIVGGDVENNTGNIIHFGVYDVEGGIINNDQSRIEGYGEYQLTGDWDNSGTFIHDTSHVRLDGSNQNITGDTVTRFYNLSAENAGIKTLLISAEVANIINLNNLEVATADDTMFVLNNSTTAIQYDNTFGSEGFVSNNLTGRLYRSVISSGTYVFPTGNTTGTYRFRPIDIVETNATTGYYVGFRNLDPSTDGLTNLSNEICAVNPNFYHLLSASNGTPAQVTINYLPADGNFVGKANYVTQWEEVLGTTNGSSGNFITMTTTGYNLWVNEPIVLSTTAPIANIEGDTSICGDESLELIGVGENPDYIYTWQTDNGAITGQGNDTITVDFINNQNSYVVLTVTDPISGCSSTVNDTLFVDIGTLPDTSISLSDSSPYIDQIIDIMNGGNNVDSWAWEYEDYSSSNQTTQHFFSDTGSYYISLQVTSPDGCIDTNGVWITVSNKINIPNIFTPNGDGLNDFFRISGYAEYELYVYNRWGQELYHGDQNTRPWDGKTIAGKDVPEGTYLFILQLPGQEDVTGNLMVNR